jgi:hypothetical protein
VLDVVLDVKSSGVRQMSCTHSHLETNVIAISATASNRCDKHPFPPSRTQIAITFIASFVAVYALETAALAAIGVGAMNTKDQNINGPPSATAAQP